MEENLSWEKTGDIIIFCFHGSIESQITSDLRREIIQILRDEQSEIAVDI